MVKRITFTSALLALTACTEAVTAPGACPDFCREAAVVVIDTVVSGAIGRDSTFRGYVSPHRGPELQTAGAGAPIPARVFVNFVRFLDSVRVVAGDTVLQPVLNVDSLVLTLQLLRKTPGVGPVNVGLYRLPTGLDSMTSFADLDPFFAGSAPLRVIVLDDTLESGVITETFQLSDLPGFAQDTLRLALGLEVISPSTAFATFGTSLVQGNALLTRHFEVDSSGTTVKRSDNRLPQFDTMVPLGTPVDNGDILVAGGTPAARMLFRVDSVADLLVEPNQIIRATLELSPSEPVIGAAGDSVMLVAVPVNVDFGKKSVFDNLFLDVGEDRDRRTAVVSTGSAARFEIDVTGLLRGWASDSTVPRSFFLMSRSLSAPLETSTPSEVRVFSTRSATAPPTLRVTYVPPVGVTN